VEGENGKQAATYSGAPGSEKYPVARIEKKRVLLISCDATSSQFPNHHTPSDTKKKLENDSGKPLYRS
jgi:hypothetical protein